jgi:hypothetical protein
MVGGGTDTGDADVLLPQGPDSTATLEAESSAPLPQNDY